MGVTRGVDSTLLSSLESAFNPVIFVYVNWPNGVVRVHTGVGDIITLGETWNGVAGYGSIQIPEEGMSVGSPTASLKLAGALADLLGELGQDPRNSEVEIYFGTTTTRNGDVLNGIPQKMFTGYVDGVNFDFNRSGDDASSSVVVNIASGPSPRAFAAVTHTAESQKFYYPLDTAGEKVISYSKKLVNPDAWPEP